MQKLTEYDLIQIEKHVEAFNQRILHLQHSLTAARFARFYDIWQNGLEPSIRELISEVRRLARLNAAAEELLGYDPGERSTDARLG